MSVYLYDEAFIDKLRNWTKDTQIQVFSPDDTKRLFEVIADTTNDGPIELPIICLRRKTGINITRQGKQPITFDGMTLAQSNEVAIKLNAIPMDINYQLDIYTRYLKEADEFLRNLTFNIINYPKLTINIPYNGFDVNHNAFIRMAQEIDDNSDVPERLIKGQFTRYTFNITIDDAYLWNIKERKHLSIQADVECEDKDLNV